MSKPKFLMRSQSKFLEMIVDDNLYEFKPTGNIIEPSSLIHFGSYICKDEGSFAEHIKEILDVAEEIGAHFIHRDGSWSTHDSHYSSSSKYTITMFTLYLKKD